jgi:hypothetical protein
VLEEIIRRSYEQIIKHHFSAGDETTTGVRAVMSYCNYFIMPLKEKYCFSDKTRLNFFPLRRRILRCTYLILSNLWLNTLLHKTTHIQQIPSSFPKEKHISNYSLIILSRKFPCRSFMACKRTPQSMCEMLCRQKFPASCFSAVILLLRYQMALAVQSGWYEIVLRQQVGHLLLKCTTFGYGTALTAACACPGCSATDYYYYY